MELKELKALNEMTDGDLAIIAVLEHLKVMLDNPGDYFEMYHEASLKEGQKRRIGPMVKRHILRAMRPLLGSVRRKGLKFDIQSGGERT